MRAKNNLSLSTCEACRMCAFLPRTYQDTMDFIICTNEVNRYGYRILPEGIQLDNFQKNPVALWMHDNWSYPVGRWENIRWQNGQLVASITFSEDEDAQRLKRLVEEQIISATSMGHRPIEWSEDPTLLLPGQTRPTVTKTELLEVSFVTVPGNPGAVRLCLAAGTPADEDFLPLIKTNFEMDKILKALALAAGAGEDAVVAAITNLQTLADTATKNAVNSLLSYGRNKGIVNDGNETLYRQLATQSFDTVQQLFEKEQKADPAQSSTPEPDAVSLSAFLADVKKTLGANQGSDKDDRTGWTFDQWSKQDPDGLLKMKRTAPDQYQALAEAKAKQSGVAMA